jgi:predicted CXXCH cytochrome family protein
MRMPSRRVALPSLVVTVLLAGFVMLLLRPTRHPAAPAPTLVGSSACATCHQQAWSLWQQSHHRHAMAVADEHSVRGDFDNATFDYYGRRSRFFTRDGGYFVETDNARGEFQTFRIAYTFGVYPLQQYLVQFPDGRLQALGISWDSRSAGQGGQRWFHLYPDRRVAHDDALHWTGAFQNWNSRCAACHTTGFTKGYQSEQDRYETRWAESNVGCEACHGPGSRHVDWAKGESWLRDKGLVTRIDAAWAPTTGARPIPPQADAPMSGQLAVCAGCHSRRAELGPPEITAPFHDNYALAALVDGLYFDDGQIRDEVFEAGSFLQSRMHQNHVACSSCHEPHAGRLRASGNALCLQCHEPQRFQTRDHFFHKDESRGAQCIACHMPARTYMGVDVRHDHSFRIPDPVASASLGVPDVCTACHQHRDMRWAADFMRRRTGRDAPRYDHAVLLARARRGDAAVVPDLLTFARDGGRAPLLRAIALQESGRFASPDQQQAIAGSLRAADPLIRAAAAAAAASLDPTSRLQLLQPLLADTSRSVRLATARQLIDVPIPRLPAALRPAVVKLFDEYRASLAYNADMPESATDLASFHAAQGNPGAAAAALAHALKLAPRYLPAMLNLADLHRARERDDLAENLLNDAVAAYPESADARHSLGLLYVRTGRTTQSVALFDAASRLAPGNPQYALVHGMSLVESGSRSAGIAMLEAAARRFPDSGAIRQALAGYRSTPAAY